VVAGAFKEFPRDQDAAMLLLAARAPTMWIVAASEPLVINGSEISVPSADVNLYSVLLRHIVRCWKRSWRSDGWSDVLIRLWKQRGQLTQIPDYDNEAIGIMLEAGVVTPNACIDVSKLHDFDRFHSSWTEPGSPDELQFWIHRVGPKAISNAVDLMRRSPTDQIGRIALGILGVGRFQLGYAGPHFTSDVATPYGDALRSLAGHLGDHLDDHRDDLGYLGAYWWAVSEAWVLDRDALGGEECDRAARSATEALGRLRPEARAASGELDTGPNRDYSELYGWVVSVLASCSGMWSAMKSLILLLRALSVPAVAADLRSRAEEGLPPPPPRWSWVAEMLLGLVHGFARHEQQRDPTLEEVRNEFARFCLERLRTRSAAEAGSGVSIGNEDMVEPSVPWRLASIRAIRELQANPADRRHRILHWSFQNDPDEDVRRAAKLAYGELVKSTGLSPDVSPRRPVFAALWWLRQAHLLGLGIPVDKQGARRTRQAEVRATDMKDTLKPLKEQLNE